MRAAILAAAESGNIAELKGAMELNELKPDFGAPAGADPIEHLKSLSADGSGRDVLEAIERLLEGAWTSIPGGRDIENNRIYVWPRFAEMPLETLTTEEQAALAELVGEDAARTILATRRWQWWRLSIGADGVWHMLARLR